VSGLERASTGVRDLVDPISRTEKREYEIPTEALVLDQVMNPEYMDRDSEPHIPEP
jgi:hypothetical protein